MDDDNFELHPQLEQDGRLIVSLGTSDWLLMNDSRFPWVVQVPRFKGATLMTSLPAEMRAGVRRESDFMVEVLQGLFNPDHINVAQIGNVVSQLHIHHVCRFTDDALWPKPIWAQTPAIPYTDVQYQERLAALRWQF